MKIRSRGYLISFALLLLFFFWCILLFAMFSGYMRIRVDLETILYIVIMLGFSYIILRAYRLSKALNFNLELGENDMVYSFFLTRSYKYSDICRMFWYTMAGGTQNILKLYLKNGRSIILCIDKLDESKRDLLIHTLRSKVRRDFNCKGWTYYY